MAAVHLLPVNGLPEIKPGDDLGGLIVAAFAAEGDGLSGDDVLVVTHKIVAKAEGALVNLRDITPTPVATAFAARWGKDARHIELVLRQSTRIVRMDRGVIIAETRHGLICANAGVDQSNIVGDDIVCVLPDNPDESAARIRASVLATTGRRIAVIVCDTFGRPWREGLTNVAIGVSGIKPIRDYIGKHDAQGRPLRVTALAVADELAGAAELVMGKLDRVPVAVIRGFQAELSEGSARELIRRPELDLFR